MLILIQMLFYVYITSKWRNYSPVSIEKQGAVWVNFKTRLSCIRAVLRILGALRNITVWGPTAPGP